MRKKPNLDARISACGEYVIADPTQYKGNWAKKFGYDSVCVEIGCGKGKFITENAKNRGNTLFVAIEKEHNVMVMAAELAQREEIQNIRFIGIDAAMLGDVFAEGELQEIYLNFSDPWPKKGQSKRRLTHRNFLAVYNTVLRDNGAIFFKTDNEKLYEFSLNEMAEFGFNLRKITFDLHSTDEENIVTEYEARFAEQGMRILRVEAHKKVN